MLAIPGKAILFPGANLAGFASQISIDLLVHFIEAFEDRAGLYEYDSDPAMFSPLIPPSAGPVVSA